MLPLPVLLQLFFNATSIQAFISTYGYAGLFGLMALEGASFPVPSEVVAPVAGYLAAKGALDFYLAALAILAGNMLGAAADYAIGYFLGKDVVYRHLALFHIKKSSLDSFDEWFARNGSAAVFASRMIPVLRGLISFPAGFAEMNFGKFMAFSLIGSAIWDVALMLFGYYLLSSQNLYLVMASIAALIIVFYIIYKKIPKKSKK